jgi:hypothetical protein
MKNKYQEAFENTHPNIKWLQEYSTAKTYTLIKYIDCGHESIILPSNLKAKGTGAVCLICNQVSSRYNKKTTKSFSEELTTKYPNIVAISEYTGIKDLISIKYKDCGHEHHTSTADSILNGSASIICRLCNPVSNGLLKSTEDIIEEVLLMHNNIDVVSKYSTAFVDIVLRYKECGHTREVRPNNLLSRPGNYGSCNICYPTGTSIAETEVLDFITSIYKGTILRNDRSKLINPSTKHYLELDILLPDIGLAFEYNGIYWHSDKLKGNRYHYNKSLLARDSGINLIHIFEDDWNLKQEVVKSRIRGLLGLNKRVYARKCSEVKPISWEELSRFAESNHLRGCGAHTNINLGLFYLGDLTAVMSFNTPKVLTKDSSLKSFNCSHELVRYCSLLNTNVVGGASKLLKYFTSNYTYTKILSYSDKRWSSGGLYKAIGFEYSHTTNPGYLYYRNNIPHSRQQFQKHKLKLKFPEAYSDAKTEHQIMEEVGFTKVSDCGNDVWVYK